MRKSYVIAWAIAVGLFTNYQDSNAQTKTFTVKANEVKANVPPTLWGIFFEDINLRAAKGTVTVLRSDKLDQVNSFENPAAISQVVKYIVVKNTKIKLPLQPYSVNVIKLKFS